MQVFLHHAEILGMTYELRKYLVSSLSILFHLRIFHRSFAFYTEEIGLVGCRDRCFPSVDVIHLHLSLVEQTYRRLRLSGIHG